MSPPDKVERVRGEGQRVTTASKRKPLTQPPHYGRIGAQPEHVRADPVQADALAALKVAQWDREKKMRRNGARATVR